MDEGTKLLFSLVGAVIMCISVIIGTVIAIVIGILLIDTILIAWLLYRKLREEHWDELLRWVEQKKKEEEEANTNKVL